MYVQVIVCYDVTDTKNRNRLFEELKDLGLVSVQKSVFWGYLLPSQKRVVKELFRKYCEKGDRAFIVNARLDENIGDTFGYGKSDFPHPEDYEII